jgi:hypothetical protein
LIGRALHCGVRFNDGAVSREHLRLVVEDRRVTAENLSRSNGTLINGRRVDARVVLEDGDELRIGHRELTVELIRVERRRHSRPITLDRPSELEPGSGLLVDDESTAEEATRPSDDWPFEDAFGRPLLAEALAAPGGPSGSRIPALASLVTLPRKCARCGAKLVGLAEICPECHHAGILGFSGAITQKIDVETLNRRTEPRWAISVPVLYASDLLTFEGIARDISLGGIFVATELLDPVGTRCQITAFPERYPAIALAGTVVHVATAASERGRPSGLGIRFTRVSSEAQRWIDEIRALSA